MMGRIARTLFAAFVLAMHAEGMPTPDGGDLVVTSTDASPTTAVSPDTTSASTKLGSMILALLQNKLPPPKIYSMHINSDIEFRFAKTLVTSRVANPADISQQVSFSVVLPQDAFITGFVMEIDGKSYHAYVKEKEEAKKTYDDAVQQGLGAAHVAYSARESNSFDVTVNIEPLKKVTFNLTYEELLKRSKGLYHHTVTISPGQVVPDMLVKVHIKEPRNLTKLYSPKFSSENKVSDVEDDPCSGDSTNSSVCTSGNEIVRKNHLSPTEAIVEFAPTLEEQKQLAQDKGKGLSGQFEVLYDVERDPSGGEVLVKDGYFVHFFAPTDLKILPKHIVFVLDVSGSMMGRKIEQVKDAMNTILSSLQPEDYFNVIVFSSEVTSWDLDKPNTDLVTNRDPFFYSYVPYTPYGMEHDPSMTTTTPSQVPREVVPAYPATQEYIQKALKRVNETQANGGTNIYGGLEQGIKTIKGHRELLQKNGDLKARKSIIMFLTDGEANVGESRPKYIISGLSELNTAPQAPIYSLTFGEDGNIDFLTKLSLANAGLARVIYEGPDADVQLKRFYRDISSPLLSNITFKYLPQEVDLDSMTKLNYHTYYQGGELVVAGRTADNEVLVINGDVSAAATDNDSKQYPVKSLPFEEPHVHLIDFIPNPRETVKVRPTTSLERAWAYLTVKQLIEKSEAEESKKVTTTESPSVLSNFPTTTGILISGSSTTSKPEGTSSTTVAKNTTEKPSAKQRALDLALKYSFVTKLTSLVVVKPNETQATEAKRIVSGESAAISGFGGYAAGLAGPPGAAGAFGGASQTHYDSLSSPAYRPAPSGSAAFPLYLSGNGGVAQHSSFLASRPVPGAAFQPSSGAYDKSYAGSGFAAPLSGWASFSAMVPPPSSQLNIGSAGVAHAAPSFGFMAPIAKSGGPLSNFGPPVHLANMGFRSIPVGGQHHRVGVVTPARYSTTARWPVRTGPAFASHRPPTYPLPPPLPAPPAYPASALSSFSSSTPKRKFTVMPVSISVDRVDSLPPVLEEPVQPDLWDKLNITDVTWLTQEALTNGTVELDVNGQKKQYNVLENADSNHSANATTCTAPGIVSGKCRHLSQCVLRVVTSSVEAYLPYQCQLENYLAVCCND